MSTSGDCMTAPFDKKGRTLGLKQKAEHKEVEEPFSLEKYSL